MLIFFLSYRQYLRNHTNTSSILHCTQSDDYILQYLMRPRGAGRTEMSRSPRRFRFELRHIRKLLPFFNSHVLMSPSAHFRATLSTSRSTPSVARFASPEISRESPRERSGRAHFHFSSGRSRENRHVKLRVGTNRPYAILKLLI